MNKQQVLDKLHSLDLPTEEYLVFSGAVLAVHELRNTEDIDIVASPQLFEQLKAETDWKLETRFEDDAHFLKGDDIDVASKLEWEAYPTTLAKAKQNEDIIDGIPFMSLPDVVQFKQAMGREKDRKDIALIETFLDARTK